MMKLTVIGLNYQTAPLSIRQKLAFSASVLPTALQSLHSKAGAEALILSTCNRTELYCVGDEEQIVRWWADFHKVPLAEMRPHIYTYGCGDTIRHAFRVASGLDSMILGEPQILGQMKDAVRCAQEQNTMGTWLNGLFQKTFAVAKDIRNSTNIGEHSLSMAATSVKMAEQVLGNVQDLNVLLVGAGEMIDLVATHFSAQSPKSLMIANRSLGRAEKLAQKLGNDTEVCLLDRLPEILHRYDAVIASTASQESLISRQMVENALKQRHGKAMFLLDLAVPRDIDEAVDDLMGATVFTVDDMQVAVQQSKNARLQAAQMAEEMVEAKVLEFIEWQQSRQRVPLICALRNEGERARQQVLSNAKKQLAKGTPPEEVLERLSVQLTNKLLHSPTRALNKAPNHDAQLVSTLAKVYDLV